MPPDPIIDLYGISFLCTNSDTLTIFSAIVTNNKPADLYGKYRRKTFNDK